MDLKDYLAISGKPGLYKSVVQSKTGVIVESLTDGKRFQAFASDKVSSLGEISIYTDTDDMPVREVFRLMQASQAETALPDAKNADKEVKAYFEKVIPQFDRDRFYVSHMRKIISWYNLLVASGVNDFTEPVEESADTKQDETAPPAEAKSDE
ncbi:MAG TPA: DUF5606 domain-containing protein [Bacteroidales bacterium]|nr:DUF5606 domain-containing protein [Bacteroidales bacterium]